MRRCIFRLAQVNRQRRGRRGRKHPHLEAEVASHADRDRLDRCDYCKHLARNALLRLRHHRWKPFIDHTAFQHRATTRCSGPHPDVHLLGRPSRETGKTSHRPQLPLAKPNLHNHLRRSLLHLGKFQLGRDYLDLLLPGRAEVLGYEDFHLLLACSDRWSRLQSRCRLLGPQGAGKLACDCRLRGLGWRASGDGCCYSKLELLVHW